MIRITETGREPGQVSLAVEGWIAGDSASLLDTECTAVLDAGERVRLDCSGVTFVDIHGADVLRRIRRRELTLAKCPQVILELLDREPGV